MASPHPPHLDAALAHLRQSLAKVGEGALDLAKAPWADIEKAVIKLLGGEFVEARPEHQAVALGLAALLAERLMAAHPSFWFPNREAPEGAMLGFADALMVLSPYAAAADALSRAQLPHLEQTQSQIRQAIGQSKFGARAAASGATPRLGLAEYARLFDPGFIQMLLLDVEKAKAGWNLPPDRLIRDLREALGRLGEELPAQAKGQLEAQLVGALGRLDPGVPLIQQEDAGPRLLELIGHLFGTQESTGAAPEEFWADVVFPIAFIGAAQKFPPAEAEEKAAIEQGADLLSLWVEMVPFATPAPEEGFLGAFDAASLTLPTPELAQGGTPRLLGVDPAAVKKPLEAFVPTSVKTALSKFGEGLEKQVGKPVSLTPDTEQMLEASFALLTDLGRLLKGQVPGKTMMCARRITEAEAASELTLTLLRKALGGPRIILAR